MSDLDRLLGTDLNPVPDWASDAKIVIRGRDPEGKPMANLDLPLSWVGDMLTRWRERNPANFGKELAETVRRWSLDQFPDA